MASYNRAILVGNLTRDVELRYTPGGTAVTDVGLAVNCRVKKNGEWTEEPMFIDVTMWGRTAEVASEYLNKGSNILVEGELRLDSWEDNDGNKRSKHFINCDKMQMMTPKGGNSKPKTKSTPKQDDNVDNSDDDDESIPF